MIIASNITLLIAQILLKQMVSKMKKILYAALIAVSFPGLANASDTIYVSLKSGISDTKISNNIESQTGINTTSIFYQANQTESITPSLSAAIGYDFSKISNYNLRTELEYTYKKGTTFDAKTTQLDFLSGSPIQVDAPMFTNKVYSQSLMFNGYYDFKNTSKFTPYLNIGIGVTHIKNQSDAPYTTSKHGTDYTDSDNHFTWSAGAGVAYNVSNNVALDLSYKYVDAGKFKFSNNEILDVKQSYKVQSNEYSLGIRYNF